MGEEAEARIAFLQSTPSRRELMSYSEALCDHGIVRDWCSYCKHGDKGPERALKVILRDENLAIVENFQKWPMRTIRTT